MDRFNQYRVFVQVAEMGSFIRAAHVLEVPRASVSAAVQQLETQLGVRLLHRTTRQVRLTADGEQLLERLRPLLAEVEDIDQSFQASQRQASGRLSVDVPSRIARRLIAPALPSLLRRHPTCSWCSAPPIAPSIWCRKESTARCASAICTTAAW